MFAKVHQPVGQVEVVHVEHLAILLEGCPIFPVRIDHDDVTLRGEIADLVKDQRGGRRLAGTGGTQKCEMLAKHGIDIERAADIIGGIDRADLDIGPAIGCIDLLEVGGGHGIDNGCGGRIASDASAEIVDLPGQLFLVALAEKIDLRDDHSRPAFIKSLRPDIGQQPGLGNAYFHLAPDLASHLYGLVVMIEQSRQDGGIHQHF